LEGLEELVDGDLEDQLLTVLTGITGNGMSRRVKTGCILDGWD